MKTGRADQHIVILRPDREVSVVSGSAKTVWVEVCRVSAELPSVRGYRVVEAAENFADYKATFQIRSNVPAEEGWRLKHLEQNRLYRISTRDVNTKRSMAILTCERVNE